MLASQSAIVAATAAAGASGSTSKLLPVITDIGICARWEFPKIRGTLFWGPCVFIRILLFRVLYLGPLFSETLRFSEQ